MSTVAKIESLISELPPADFWKLAEWFDEAKADAWDVQIEEDAKAGRIDFLWEQARKEIATGETVTLDEFLADQKLPQ